MADKAKCAKEYKKKGPISATEEYEMIKLIIKVAESPSLGNLTAQERTEWKGSKFATTVANMMEEETHFERPRTYVKKLTKDIPKEDSNYNNWMAALEKRLFDVIHYLVTRQNPNLPVDFPYLKTKSIADLECVTQDNSEMEDAPTPPSENDGTTHCVGPSKWPSELNMIFTDVEVDTSNTCRKDWTPSEGGQSFSYDAFPPAEDFKLMLEQVSNGTRVLPSLSPSILDTIQMMKSAFGLSGGVEVEKLYSQWLFYLMRVGREESILTTIMVVLDEGNFKYEHRIGQGNESAVIAFRIEEDMVWCRVRIGEYVEYGYHPLGWRSGISLEEDATTEFKRIHADGVALRKRLIEQFPANNGVRHLDHNTLMLIREHPTADGCIQSFQTEKGMEEKRRSNNTLKKVMKEFEEREAAAKMEEEKVEKEEDTQREEDCGDTLKELLDDHGRTAHPKSTKPLQAPAGQATAREAEAKMEEEKIEKEEDTQREEDCGDRDQKLDNYGTVSPAGGEKLLGDHQGRTAEPSKPLLAKVVSLRCGSCATFIMQTCVTIEGIAYHSWCLCTMCDPMEVPMEQYYKINGKLVCSNHQEAAMRGYGKENIRTKDKNEKKPEEKSDNKTPEKGSNEETAIAYDDMVLGDVVNAAQDSKDKKGGDDKKDQKPPAAKAEPTKKADKAAPFKNRREQGT